MKNSTLISTIPWLTLLTPTRAVSPSHTYPVASMWIVALHSLYLHSDHPPTLSPSFRLAQHIFGPNIFPYIYPNIFYLFILYVYPPMKMGQCSETLAYKIQSPGNYPEESVQNSEHGEILKSRIT